MTSLTELRDTIAVQGVFGAPLERDGVTVLPAASVRGGGGEGHGHDQTGEETSGLGMGLVARPTGAYVIRDGKVAWRPAVDVNRMIAAAALVAALYLLTRRRR